MKYGNFEILFSVSLFLIIVPVTHRDTLKYRYIWKRGIFWYIICVFGSYIKEDSPIQVSVSKTHPDLPTLSLRLDNRDGGMNFSVPFLYF